MITVNEIWPAWGEVITLSDLNDTQSQWMLNQLLSNKTTGQCLLSGYDSSSTQEQFDNLVEKLVTTSLKTIKDPVTQIRSHTIEPASATDEMVSVINRVVEQGAHEKRWSFCPKNISARIKRKPSKFHRIKFDGALTFRKLESLFNKSIGLPLPENSEAKVGLLMMSAIIRVGMLSGNSLYRLQGCVANRTTLSSHNNLVWFTFVDPATDNLQRWFLDPVTEMLYLRCLSLPDETLNTLHTDQPPSPYLCIKAYFISLGLKKKEFPRSLSAILSQAETAHRLSLLPFLASYATGKHISWSLKTSAWHRVLGLTPIEIDDEPTTLDSSSLPTSVVYTDNSGIPSYWISQIYQCLRHKSGYREASTAKSMLSDLQKRADNNTNVSTTLILLIKWSIYRLSHPLGRRPKLQTSSVYSYISTAGRRLYGLAEMNDLSNWVSMELDAIYQQIIELANSKSQTSSLAKVCADMHHYFYEFHNFSEVDMAETFAAQYGSAVVDANLLTFNDFEDSIRLMEQLPIDQTYKDSLQCFSTLSFRTGARRNEVLMLRCSDIALGQDAGLIRIQPHHERKLKTIASKRAIPIHSLCTTSEIKQLKSRSVYDDQTTYLFPSINSPHKALQEERLIPDLHRVLRTVTKDPSIKNHHNRHSAASWLLLSLVCNSLCINPSRYIPAASDKTVKWLQDSIKRSRSLYNVGETIPEGWPMRSHLFYVSRILGHSSPSVTLEHYIHTCDLMLRMSLDQYLGDIPAKVIQTITGKSLATTYRASNDPHSNKLIKQMRQQHANFYEHLSNTDSAYTPSKSATTVHNQTSLWDTLHSNWDILYLHDVEKIALKSLEDRFGISKNKLKSLIENARIIRDLTPPHGNGHKHRMLKITFEGGTNRTICPSPVRRINQLSFIGSLFGMAENILEHSETEILWATDYYVHHVLQKNNVKFSDYTVAKRYLKVLRSLSIPWRSIHLNITGNAQSRSDVSHLKRHWRDKLPLPANQHLPVFHKDTKSNETGWLDIKVTDELGAHLTQFRFLMVMLWISNH
jgi:integrase